MRYDVITLFPELISGYFEDSIIKKARQQDIISVHMHQLRDHATDKHKQVDDSPFGGGSGMLIKADVLDKAVEHVEGLDKTKPVVVYLSPQGKKLNNKLAKELAKKERFILVCGRYEGVDQRFIDTHVDMEISIGDYVLSGGELAAAVFIDAVSRFIPGVVGKEESVLNDSLENDNLKYPQYTKPREYKGMNVPDVLLSGNHKEIDEWRKNKQRPVNRNIKDRDMFVTLVHYPIKDKDNNIISTAVTNLDIHDIARLSATFGFKNYYIVTPIVEQKALVGRIVNHWKGDYGKLRNNKRSFALDKIKISSSVQDVASDISLNTGKKVKIIATTAKNTDRSVSMSEFTKQMDDEFAYLIMFGTGWGLSEELIDKADYVLAPLSYQTGYNHLSVRSAVSIIMDRLYNELGGLE
jgi:tRNA (guanine37-N1)-methyltransferase